MNDIEITPVRHSKTDKDRIASRSEVSVNSTIISKNQDLQYLYRRAPITLLIIITPQCLMAVFTE